MSMSQEEIESLMNGLDLGENETSDQESIEEEDTDSVNMSEDDIEALIAETNSNVKEMDSDVSVSNDDIDDLLASLENEDSTTSVSDEDIDSLINDLANEKIEDDEETEINLENDTDDLISDLKSEGEEVSADNEDIDALINNLTQNEHIEDNKKTSNKDEIEDLLSEIESTNNDSIVDDDYLKELDSLNIDTDAVSLATLDVSKNKKSDNYEKVVDLDKINIPSQLTQVNSDSEEKATVIFDILSSILDANNETRNALTEFEKFFQSQQKLLETLNSKFPNVKEFSDSLDSLNLLISKPAEISTSLSNRDNDLFSAMELMQFHDINRQKIERVMRVVTSLSRQLNTILDDESFDGVPVSKHLPGDNTPDIVNHDDLESLIAEYNK